MPKLLQNAEASGFSRIPQNIEVAFDYSKFKGINIGWDARGISSPHDGIARHMRAILEEWIILDDVQITAFVLPQEMANYESAFLPQVIPLLRRSVKWVPAPEFLNNCRERPIWPRLLKSHRVDIFHSHYGTVPFRHWFGSGPVGWGPQQTPCPCILTLHDLIPIKFPQLYSGLSSYLQATLPSAVQRAARIITDSQWSKRDIIEQLRVSPEKVSVVPLGVNPRFRPLRSTHKAMIERLKRQYCLPDRFILWIGALRPTKNVPVLLEAFSYLKNKAQVPHALVLTRGTMLEDRRILDTLSSTRLLRDVIFLDAVPEEDMPLLYNAAELFVFPSLYEGFGLPPLEAMACGTPVVCSNAASLPEVVGDAAVQIDPHDTLELAAAMWMVLCENELRDEMVIKGLDRAQQFNWQRTAEQTMSIYSQVLGT